MLIRKIKLEDADNFVNLIKQVEAEADFVKMEKGKRKFFPIRTYCRHSK